MQFGATFDLGFSAEFELDQWNSDWYYYADDDEYYSDYYEESVTEYEYGINDMNELEEAVDDMDHFYVVSMDDVNSDGELNIYPEPGQVIGILFFSQNSDAELEFDEIFRDTDEQ